MVRRRIEVLVDADQARMVGIAAGDRMVLELAEPLREGDMLGLADLLIAQEQHLVREQRLAGSRRTGRRCVDRLGEVDAD